MRTPRSAAPVFAASRVAVFAPSAMAVKISNSIPVFSAAVCWKAFRALKMCSGLGRLAAVGVAMDELSCRGFRGQRLYMRIVSKGFSSRQVDCPQTVRLAYFLLPATAMRQIDETRISPLVLSPARHGARRSCLWTLGRAPAGFPDQCGRRVGARRPEHGRGTRGFHRCRENQILHAEFDQWAELLQQGSAPVSPQLRAVRVRFLFARRGRSFYLEQLPVRGHCHFNDGRFLWRVPRREQPLQAPGCHQALLRDVRRIRPAELYGRHVRRQFLLQQSRRLSLERQRSLVLPANRYLRHSHLDGHRPVGKQRAYLPPLGGSRQQGHLPFAGQLGSAGRPRLAVLETPDARIYFQTILSFVFAGMEG